MSNTIKKKKLTCTALRFSPLKLFLKHKLFLDLLWINYIGSKYVISKHILEKLLGPLRAAVCVLCSFDSSGSCGCGTLVWMWMKKHLHGNRTQHQGGQTLVKIPYKLKSNPLRISFIYLNFHFITAMRCSQKWIHERLLYHWGSYTNTLFSSFPTAPLTSGVYLKGINACCALLFNYTLTTENSNT